MGNFRDILQQLSKEYPELERVRTEQGKDIAYLPWYNVAQILDDVCPTWKSEVGRHEVVGDPTTLEGRLMVEVIISIRDPESGEWISRSDWGFETFKKFSDGKVKDVPFGDVFSNAISMATRRAASRFGVGRYLYRRGKEGQPQGQGRPSGQQGQQQQGQNPPQAGPGPATEKQVAALRAIANAKGFDADQEVDATFGIRLEDLSRKEASELIDSWKKGGGQ